MTALLAQISDPHLRLTDDGEAAFAALVRVVDEITALPNAVDAVLVSGDLADTGDAREYELVARALAPLRVPVLALPGNHDVSAAFGDAFGPPRWSARAGALRIVGCDTSIAGRPDGALDLDWLERELAAEPDTPTLLAMHHPPFATGLPALDAIGLAEADRRGLAALLERSPQVRRVAAGHVHRTAVGAFGRCGAVTCASTHRNTRLEIGAPDFDITPGGGQLLLHALLDDGALVSHAEPIHG